MSTKETKNVLKETKETATDLNNLDEYKTKDDLYQNRTEIYKLVLSHFTQLLYE